MSQFLIKANINPINLRIETMKLRFYFSGLTKNDIGLNLFAMPMTIKSNTV